MMKKILFVLIIAVAALPLSGQVPADDVIKAEVFNPGSKYYYPPLLSRYMKGDTTLTADDYHYLYYGFAFQDEYHPLDPIPAETDLLAIFDGGGHISKEDAEKVIFYAGEVMRRDPFSPTNINFMTYAYGILGDKEREKISAARLRGVLETIASSGTGLREGMAWHVISFSHVNDFLASKGLEVSSRRVVSRTIEYVSLVKPDNGKRGYYFHSGRAYSKPPTETPEKPAGMKVRDWRLFKRTL